MDFENLQVIWNSQNSEKMYAINESALFDYIKHKGRSINRLVTLFEFALVGASLFAGITLLVAALDKKNPLPQLILAVFYLAFVGYGMLRRLMRSNAEKPFDHTMLGELDKAIWRIDYLVRQSRNIIIWYLLPLSLIIAIMSFFNVRLLPALGLLLIVTVATFFASRWEINKFHLPNKHNLEALRDKLIAQENNELK